MYSFRSALLQQVRSCVSMYFCTVGADGAQATASAPKFHGVLCLPKDGDRVVADDARNLQDVSKAEERVSGTRYTQPLRSGRKRTFR